MPELTLKQFEKDEYPIWDSFVASSTQGTIFNTTGWAECIKEVFGVQHALYGVFRNDSFVGGISFFHKKKLGLPLITKFLLTPYCGILFSLPQEQKYQKALTEQNEIIDLLLAQLEQQFAFIHLSLHPAVFDLRQFLWRNWQSLPQYTYINSLANLSEAWERLSSSTRRKINRAEEKQLVISEKTDPMQLLQFQEESYSRNHLKPPLPFHLFKRYCDVLLRKKFLRIFSISDKEGNVYGERAVVVWKSFAYDWIAGTNPQYLDENANHLLAWEIFKKLSSEGAKTFDFLGANTPSIVEFKRSFGGELVTYFEVRYFSSAMMKALETLNRKWILMRRRM